LTAGRDVVVHCRGVAHRFGERAILHDVDLEVARGQFVGLVGPSGCGKSTLLNAIFGTLAPDRGEVEIHARRGDRYPVRGIGPDRCMVYQDYDLYPHLTALGNVAFGLMVRDTSITWRALRPFAWRARRRELHARAAALLERVGLGQALDKYPHELSGGMRQRVALAQAIVMEPEVLLLDEPFGALDEANREGLQQMLLAMYAENMAAVAAGASPPHTLVIVTHEIDEALLVGDRVVGLSQFWDWRGAGHAASPGATVVYDAAAPVESPGTRIDRAAYAPQRTLIREVVMDPSAPKPPPAEHVRFWRQAAAGEARGVVEGMS
jgi:NitT/TauT family transport system ATP-binding protein